MKKLIVFDWDGTLCNSIRHIGLSIQAACFDTGYLIPSYEKASFVVGLGLDDALSYLGMKLSYEEKILFTKNFHAHYLKGLDRLPLFCGVVELLSDLINSGCQLAIATGKSRRGLDSALAAHQLDAYFVVTRCADECFNKPNPLMLFELLEITGCHSSEALMIGDTSYDLQMAQNAGLASVAVTYGAHKENTLKRFSPLFLANNIADLDEGLKKLILEDRF